MFWQAMSPPAWTHPAFDNSAMDGYAGHHEDFAEIGTELSVIGESAAGRGFSGPVGRGEVVRIFTGAPVPAGADTVLIQEDAEKLPGQPDPHHVCAGKRPSYTSQGTGFYRRRRRAARR